MSIDLGFAPCTIGDIEVGIVDVPGHENFIKTMVAGAAGMDAVLLVVAADDGVMPQTREHLDILTLLGVRYGMVALTKIDRVDEETHVLAREDITQFVQGTFLEGKPILPVSSVTGEGFNELLEALLTLLESIEPKTLDGLFRLPIDRAFSAKGHGTIVAGIPTSGSVKLDDEVELLPHGITGRIRGIEVYGRKSDTVKAGQCAALNVRHFEHHKIQRGDTLAEPGYFSPHSWFTGIFQMLPLEHIAVKTGSHVRLHTGTAEVGASVYAMHADQMRAGEEHLVQIKTNTPVVAGPRDHFILRTLSPMRTVGGGLIIESTRGKLRRRRSGVVEQLREKADAVRDRHRFVEYCLRTAPGLAASASELSQRVKLPGNDIEDILTSFVAEGTALRIGRNYIHQATMASLSEKVLQLVKDFHQASPESPGVTLDHIREQTRFDHGVLDGIVERLTASGHLEIRKGRLADPAHQSSFQDQEAEYLETIERLFQEQPFHPPQVEEFVEKTGAPEDVVRKLLHILREHQKLVRIGAGQGLLFHCDAVERARQILVDYIHQEGRLESVKFKYLLDTTRKFALPLLDHFDRIGVTRRDGNTRYLREQK